MARSQNLSFLIATLALTSLIAAGCDSGTQEPDAPADAPMKIENAAAPSGSVEFAASRYPTELPEGVSAAVPDNFPKEFPIYPGSAPAQGRGVEVEGVPMAALQLLTMDPPEKVFGFYREQLEGAGWELEDKEEYKGKNAISATRGKCKASMFVSPTDDGGSDIYLVSEC
ncbi:MAG: hypothetical protein ABGX04_16015 [Myxococcales bacterium]